MATVRDAHVDPELLPLLEGFPDIPLNAETLPGFRAAMVDMAVLPDPATHPGVTIEEVSVPGPDGALRCLLFRPADGAAKGALLHVHGGGGVMGLPEMDALRNVALVEATGCVILSPDYRLAPEHPHPAALEDCHSAGAWLASQAGQFGFPPERLGVIGESAGGGFAAALALLARDRGSISFACQVLIYPMLASPGAEAAATHADNRIGRHIWNRDADGFAWGCMLGASTGDAVMPPAAAADLAGLPPAFIAVGELDLFVHDDLAYASRLLAAGISTEAHLYPGAFHGFDRMGEAAVSQRFNADLLDFLKRHLG